MQNARFWSSINLQVKKGNCVLSLGSDSTKNEKARETISRAFSTLNLLPLLVMQYYNENYH